MFVVLGSRTWESIIFEFDEEQKEEEKTCQETCRSLLCWMKRRVQQKKKKNWQQLAAERAPLLILHLSETPQ